MEQLAEYSWSHICHSPLITRGSAVRVQLVTLLLLSTHHPWISWQSTAGHTSVSLHSSPVDQLAEYSWSHFCYSPLITHGSAGRAQLVTLLLLSIHNPWISWQSTYGHTSLSLHSPPVDQLAEHSWSHFALLSTHHPWISWQSTAGHTSATLSVLMVTLVTLLFLSLITRGSAGRAQLVTLLSILHSSPVEQLARGNWHKQNTAGHTSVTLHSSRGSTVLSTAGHTSATLQS